MPAEPPPLPPRRSPWAYALAAAAIWTMAACDLLIPQPPHQVLTMAVAARTCLP